MYRPKTATVRVMCIQVFFFPLCNCLRTLSPLDSLDSQAHGVQSDGSLCQGMEPEGEDPRCRIRISNAGGQTGFPLGLDRCYRPRVILYLGYKFQFQERIFLSSTGWHVPLYVVCNICHIFQSFYNEYL